MKIDLTDTSLLIALKIDSQDRIDNLDIAISYIKHHFNTEIIISEQGPEPVLKNRYECTYVYTKVDEFFNRQKGVNIAARHSNNPIIVHYDADILVTPKQLAESIDPIRKQELELVLPYNGEFYDVPKQLHAKIHSEQSIEWLKPEYCKLFTKQGVGGIVCFNKEVFWKNGGANENFKGLGYEDNEIFDRFKKLKTKMGRYTLPLYHLTHVRKDTSYNFNPHVNENASEYVRIRDMSYKQLCSEVDTWKWNKL